MNALIKIYILSILTFLTLALMPSFSQPVKAQSPSPSPTATVTVSMQNTQFSPQTIIIAPGTTVTWVNQDSVNHTTSADDLRAAENWTSGTLLPGESFSKTFNAPGIYTYHCTLHPQMTGTVQVVIGGGGVQAEQKQPVVVATPAPVATLPVTGVSGTVATSPAPVTTTLPATGAPVSSIFLVGLVPIGWKLIRFGKRIWEEETPFTLWEKRQLSKL